MAGRVADIVASPRDPVIGLQLEGIGRIRFRELISWLGDPDIERWQQKDTECQVGNQAAYDDNGEGPLGIGPDVMR